MKYDILLNTIQHAGKRLSRHRNDVIPVKGNVIRSSTQSWMYLKVVSDGLFDSE